MKNLLFSIGGIICYLLGLRCNNKKSSLKSSREKLVLENTISMDRQSMFNRFGGVYRWYESNIVLKNYLDSENTSSEIEKVTNVFQVLGEDGDPIVVMFTHDNSTSDIDVREHAFIIEDSPINEENIEVTFTEAYEQVMESNSVRPHSRMVVLRKEIGSEDCNAQYVFGNSSAQLYVDVVTGDVSVDNPAFKK